MAHYFVGINKDASLIRGADTLGTSSNFNLGGDEVLEVGKTFQAASTSVGTIQRFVDLGQTEEAERLINGHPEVLQTLDAKQVGKIVRSIELQKIQKARALAEKNLEREGILQAAGDNSPQELSPQLRLLYYTGKMGTQPKDDRTPSQKNAEALTRIEQKHGKDSAAYRNLRWVIDSKTRLPKSELTIKLERLEELEDRIEELENAN